MNSQEMIDKAVEQLVTAEKDITFKSTAKARAQIAMAWSTLATCQATVTGMDAAFRSLNAGF